MFYEYDKFGWLVNTYLEPQERTTELAPPISNVADTPGQLRANFTGVEWVILPYVKGNEPESLELKYAIAKAIRTTYDDVDEIYRLAVGSRATEYAEAEIAAKAYRDSGYTSTPSDYITTFAQYNPTGLKQTNQWSAESILYQAAAFRMAQGAMRSQRFVSQYLMRKATTVEQLKEVVAQWNLFIAQLRGQLGL